MLVVTRKRNESIMIGSDVEVKIIGVRENQVKVGVVAPREVQVHRREVFDRIQRGEPPRRKFGGDEPVTEAAEGEGVG
jgi:carbon storage regulator